MQKFNEWQQAKLDLERAESWYSNKNKIDSQDGKRYTSITSSVKEGFFQYCGQSYAGANNYHESPGGMSKFIQKAIHHKRDEIISEAISLMRSRCDELSLDAKGDMQQMIKIIDGANK